MKLYIYALVFIVLASFSYAELQCEVADSCSDAEIVSMDKLSNAHASLPGYSGYQYNLCCRDTGYRNLSLDSGNCSDTTLFRLSANENSNLALKNYTGFNVPVCLSADSADITCSYSPDCSDYQACVATLTQGVSNLHIGSCTNPHPQHVCCNLTYVPNQSLGESCVEDIDCLSGNCGIRPDGTGVCIEPHPGCINQSDHKISIGSKVCFDGDSYTCMSRNNWSRAECYDECGIYSAVDSCSSGDCEDCQSSCSNNNDCDQGAVCVNNICRLLEEGSNPPVLVQDIPDITINESQSLEAFDLDNYFSDPEGDILSYNYSISGSNYTQINIDAENKVTISSIEGWSGECYAVFTAMDGMHETESNNITITTQPVEGFLFSISTSETSPWQSVYAKKKGCYTLDKFGKMRRCEIDINVWQ